MLARLARYPWLGPSLGGEPVHRADPHSIGSSSPGRPSLSANALASGLFAVHASSNNASNAEEEAKHVAGDALGTGSGSTGRVLETYANRHELFLGRVSADHRFTRVCLSTRSANCLASVMSLAL
eukprot:1793315-Amphidinium_carterae.10